MSRSHPFSIAVLISGNGSNLQAIIDAIRANLINATIDLVISNKVDAKGLERANRAGIPCKIFPHTQYNDRESFDRAMLETLEDVQPDLVVLAGFMRILSPMFVKALHGKLINIHPSLLPRYKGTHTHHRVLKAKETLHGCSVHFVTEELDGGPVIAQSEVSIYPNDTENLLAKRVQQEEHSLYPYCIKLITQKRLVLNEDKALLDNQVLPLGGIKFRKSNYDKYYFE